MAALARNIFYSNHRKFNFSRVLSTQSTISNILQKGECSAKQSIQGWVSSIRKMKDLIFVDISDGSTSAKLQVVIPKSIRPSGLSNGSSLKIYGPLTRQQNGQLELAAEQLELLGPNDAQKFPFSAKQNHSHDYCRQFLHFRPKLPHFQSLLRIRHKVLQSMHAWFDSHEFIGVHTPMLTSNDCEGAGEIFHVLPSQALVKEMKKKEQTDSEAFFGSSAYLSVSGQLHLEAITRGFSRCYAISPTFRAENSKSRLHLSEFYMVEAEEAFIDDIELLLHTIENFVRDTILKTVENCRQDLEVICKYDSVDPVTHLRNLETFAKKEFIRLSFSDACDIVKKHKDKFTTCNCEVDGLSKEHELFLVDHFQQNPIFIVDWPAHMKPFYMKSSEEDTKLVSAVDLLVPNVGELCGGSLREDDVAMLTKKLSDHGILESMQWYVDIRRYGNVPTAGFGLGFERFLQLVTGLTNIKDTIPFPRWPHSLKM